MRRGQGVIKYDVAILTLGQPVDFARFPHIRPVCLPSTEDLTLDLTNKTGTAIGWGLDSVIYQETTCDYTMGVPVQENKAVCGYIASGHPRLCTTMDKSFLGHQTITENLLTLIQQLPELP